MFEKKKKKLQKLMLSSKLFFTDNYLYEGMTFPHP